MRVLIALFMISVVATGCSDGFTSGPGGLKYKIVKEGSGEPIKNGQYIEVDMVQYLQTDSKDSVLRRNPEMIPYIELVDSTMMEKDFYNIMIQLRKGDSVNIKIITDSAFKQNMTEMPPFMKRGQHLVTAIRVKDIHATEAAANEARSKYFALAQEGGLKKFEEQKQKDEQILQDYFTQNKLKPTKTPLGMYVDILEPGTGAMIDTSVVVKVNYTGKNMKGVTFDSNVDPAFGHVEPFLVNMTQDPSLGLGVIPGWTEGLKFLNKGAKAKFYIPSALAYRDQQQGEHIEPNSILIFDIEVLDILNKEEGRKAQDEMVKKVMEKAQLKDVQIQANPSGQ
ncbi:MAG TPA: FKBP-type peptidyl-prolyl cis-trans isomerase [Ferruginibacter sp.]|nr:FKBP-type peptidyl-prolyl cis-trans isomerase [Ferruginibacter sp.]HRO06817.1 FKBP-type peptidyl-prolyl cis-trans isomerase [Ferruginibacter sp.]HRO96397.1 FKBP-type peptidyl-prolyl cis-trans isomerase [Ferruginibacter sp.]HRP48502.1 FKBP-type peptidyl-prolyl cis-trans isomerase [Ferruginibacter sp.]